MKTQIQKAYSSFASSDELDSRRHVYCHQEKLIKYHYSRRNYFSPAPPTRNQHCSESDLKGQIPVN